MNISENSFFQELFEILIGKIELTNIPQMHGHILYSNSIKWQSLQPHACAESVIVFNSIWVVAHHIRVWNLAHRLLLEEQKLYSVTYTKLIIRFPVFCLFDLSKTYRKAELSRKILVETPKRRCHHPLFFK